MQPPLTDRLAEDLEAAFPELVAAEIDVVYTVLVRAGGGQGDDVDDILQETFLRAYSALCKYTGPRIRELNLRSWLLTIAMNLWRNELRRRSRHPVASSDSMREEIDREGPDQKALRRETNEEVAAALRSLSDIYRDPIVLRFVVGLSVAETAEVLGRPTGTVKAQVARGLALLRMRMEPEVLEEAQ